MQAASCRCRGGDQQDPLGLAGAKPAVALRILEEGYRLLEFCFRFVGAGDVLKGRAGIPLDVDLGLALADRQAAEALIGGHPSDDEPPEGDQKPDRQKPGQQVREKVALDPTVVGDVVLLQLGGEIRIDAGRVKPCRATLLQGLLEGPDDVVLRDGDPLDLAALQKASKLAVVERSGLLLRDRPALKQREQKECDARVPEVDLVW